MLPIDRKSKRITLAYDRNAQLTEFGKITLSNRYLFPDEDYQDCFARVADAYADDDAHAQRLYDYISKLWFMPSTPVLSNGGTKRGLPISCYLNETEDSLEGIVKIWTENVWLAARGGGIGSYWGNLRSIGEKIAKNGETCGIMPFIKVVDSLILAISQGSLRRGSSAVYLPVEHPEIEEFIDIRRPTGGDPNRRCLNLHHGVIISDTFMHAVDKDDVWHLRTPKDGTIIRSISARQLWMKMLTARIEMGEPYFLFIDHVNKHLPEHHRKAGLTVKSSNLCSEIVLPTGRDMWGKERTAVCCLSSVNIEKYLEWENDPYFIEDCLRFLDNVLQDFIDRAPESMERAKYSAMRERSVGLGAMGLHAFFQSQKLAFESLPAKLWNTRIFKHIKEQADIVSKKLALEKGAAPDAAAFDVLERFSYKIAIAPTASISILAQETSPGIEPYTGNIYTQKTLSGSFIVKNRYLQALLDEKGQNTEEVWQSILRQEGSVQHLEFLTTDEKNVFRTAFEMNQDWLIRLAADRQPFVCQAQSLNIFVPADVHKKTLHSLHFNAWKYGVKSLYYCRSKSLRRPEMQFDECLACQ